MPQPGMPSASGEDWMVRRLQDLERQVQELKAANVFGRTGITPKDGGTDFDGYVNVNGPLEVSGAANFTGNTTIGGTATVVGNVTKSNAWGSASLGDAAVIGTPGAGSPSVSFTRTSATFGQTVGIGLKDSSGISVLTVNGPHSSDPAFLQLSSDQTFNLASSSTGPQVSGEPGGNGRLKLFGGQTNGGIQLSPFGTGNVQVYGNFAVTGSKAFIMDHPVNPDAMELMHAATESPVNGVEYWGTVTIDATGEATATLPGYFEALTKATGRNIQLTTIGRSAGQVSADRIIGGAFTVYGAPGQEVDWIVKAERQRIVDGRDELAFPAEQDKLIIGPRLPEGGSQ